MFTLKDLEFKTIFVINCIQKRNLRVSSGELLLEEEEEKGIKILTKLPFQKVLALFIIGHITITTPLIDKCKKFNVALVVMKPNLRPVFYWSNSAEANYLLRQKQYSLNQKDITIAKHIVKNKIENDLTLLSKTRKKDTLTLDAIYQCHHAIGNIDKINEYDELLGIEGHCAKVFFQAYFQNCNWIGRYPRTKCDIINVTLDIGYTLLFNFIECFIRMFGFDLYIGIYHQMWFKRKSLICDLMEPFRCIINHIILLAFNRKQFSEKDFLFTKGEYHLKYEKYTDYYRIFFDALIERKMDCFKYIQSYYRSFMQGKDISNYPKFLI